MPREIPYVTFDKLAQLFQWLGAQQGDVRLDETALRAAGLKGTSVSEVNQALRILDLVDREFKPTPELLHLARKPDDRPAQLRRLAERCFSDLTAIFDCGTTYLELDEVISRRPGVTNMKSKRRAFLVALNRASGGRDPKRSKRTATGSGSTDHGRRADPLPSAGTEAIGRYEEILLGALAEEAQRLNEPGAINQFEAIADRYERWARRAAPQ